MRARLRRRIVTIPLLLTATVAVTGALPLLLPLALLMSALPEWRGAARTLLFVLAYLWCETAGVVVAGALWMKHLLPTRRSRRWPRFLDDNHRLQCAWARTLMRAAAAIFRLSFEVDGKAALEGPGGIMMARHASMADTVIPIVFYAIPSHIRLRYVLKHELLLDPCLDVVGNRLPNCFVDRDAEDAKPEIARIGELTRDLAADEGVLIFPEGTRFSPQRRARIVARLAERVDAAERARFERWTELLPPKLGGPLALLDTNPGRDLVFCASTGFEGSTHFSTLVNGAWTGARIRVRFWRVPFAEIPAGLGARRAFLYDQWDRMHETVVALRDAPPSR
jgi:1-acyl-sn-glycerol-3-phosphate acyltransferase